VSIGSAENHHLQPAIAAHLNDPAILRYTLSYEVICGELQTGRRQKSREHAGFDFPVANLLQHP
jgi:hypothetical protein